MATSPPSRIRDLARRTLREARDRLPAPVAQGLEQGRALLRRQDSALLRQLSGRLGDLADLAATQLLASDDAAAELAFLMEELTEGREGDDVAWQLLRHSPLLDGTLIGLLDPLMRHRHSAHPPDLDPALVRRGRLAVGRTLAALHADRTGPGEPEATAEQPDLDSLDEAMGLDRFPHLAAALRGELNADAEARFVLFSYTLFLQAWLLRHVGHTAAQTFARLADSRAPTLDHTGPRDHDPSVNDP